MPESGVSYGFLLVATLFHFFPFFPFFVIALLAISADRLKRKDQLKTANYKLLAKPFPPREKLESYTWDFVVTCYPLNPPSAAADYVQNLLRSLKNYLINKAIIRQTWLAIPEK